MMYQISKTVFLFLLLTAFLSCKDSGKTQTKEATKHEKKELTKENKKRLNSVMTKLMVTPEAKTFTGLVITAGLTDFLAKEDGPFTLLVPTVEAFKNLNDSITTKIHDPAAKAFLESLLKSHILKTNMDTVLLTQKLNEGSGMYQTINLLGDTVTFASKGDSILVSTELGAKATLTKTDIKGGNGVVHLLDKVLVNH